MHASTARQEDITGDQLEGSASWLVRQMMHGAGRLLDITTAAGIVG